MNVVSVRADMVLRIVSCDVIAPSAKYTNFFPANRNVHIIIYPHVDFPFASSDASDCEELYAFQTKNARYKKRALFIFFYITVLVQ